MPAIPSIDTATDTNVKKHISPPTKHVETASDEALTAARITLQSSATLPGPDSPALADSMPRLESSSPLITYLEERFPTLESYAAYMQKKYHITDWNDIDSSRDEVTHKINGKGETSKSLEPPPPVSTINRDCNVCAETFPTQDFPSLADCDHIADVCNECFLQWLGHQMESVQQVKCPSSGCSNTITHEDVRKYAPRDAFTR